VDAQRWRLAGKQVKVGGILLVHELEESIDLGHSRLPVNC
jgi:hypothetical protein